ncbi:AMP-binding protein [Novosphingobium resinovorum]
MGFSAFDVVMPCQSLYHATAWGLPFAGAINGAKFVLPADRMDGASLDELVRSEGVTFSGGVPTIWTMYLDHLDRTGETPARWSACSSPDRRCRATWRWPSTGAASRCARCGA